jgi:site-specific DNA-methyltransferase (adenine-specific)
METNTIFNCDFIDGVKSIPDKSIDLIVTDPPYKVTAKGCSGSMSGYWTNSKSNKGIIFDNNNTDIDNYIDELYRVLKDDTHCYIMCNQLNLPHFLDVITKSKFHYVKCLIWDKCNKICGRYYMNCFEYIILLRKGGDRPINDCGTPDILRVPNIKTKNDDGTNIHDSEKPIHLMEILIQNSSNEGDLVLDPFIGSGTTAISCLNLNRKFIGFEIDKKFFGIAQGRIQSNQQQLTIF